LTSAEAEENCWKGMLALAQGDCMIGEKGLLTEGLFLDKDVSDYLTFFSQNLKIWIKILILYKFLIRMLKY
jgi:hypothetical protein